MKKARSCITILLLMALLGGCAAQSKTEPPASTTSIPTNTTTTSTDTPRPTPTASNSAMPEDVQISTDIPDAVWDPTEANIQTNPIYENEQYIYFTVDADSTLLMACDKKTGKITKIEQDCPAFAYQDHTFYLVKADDKGNNLIRFDERTMKSTQLKTFESIVNNLCIYDNKLYFVIDERKAANDEPIFNLYRMNTDGTSFEKMKDNVAGLCFYKDKMYYSPMYGETGAAIYEYDMATKAERKVTKTDNSSSFSAIFNHAKLVYRKMRAGDEILDLKTGDTVGGFISSYRAVYGQYFVYQFTTKQFTVYLKAYDTTTGKTYTLTEMTDLIKAKGKQFKYMAGTEKNIYLIEITQSAVEIYKLMIEGGKARLEKVSK